MTRQTLGNKDPSHRLGVKYLDALQLENTFPDYPALLERIEDQRKIMDYASQLPRQNLEQRQPQMYDNVYAILGGRGTGKSSVLLTLREHLMKSDHQDIVFPIITPEVISGDDCSIIGWIMSMAGQMVTEIEANIQWEISRDARIAREMLDTKMNFFKDCRFNRNNKLREQYQTLMRDCIQDIIPLSSYSFDEMVGMRVHLSHRHYMLIQKLNKFWYDLADSWRALNMVKKKSSQPYRVEADEVTEQPLIILLFDDVDLVPERSMELLNTTFQYFTNSNIVLILTAAEKMLKRVIWMKMLERLAGSDYNSLLVDFFQKQSIQALAESEAGKGERTEGFSIAFVNRMEKEYYDKVIPPSSRFYLRRFAGISERRRFRYASTRQSFELPRETESKPLGDFLMQQIDDLIGNQNDNVVFRDGLPRKNFLADANGQTREAYLLIFGDKNRSISNGCLSILNCVFQMKQLAVKRRGQSFTEAERGKITNVLRHLLQTLLLSKSEVSEFHDLVDSFLYQRGPQRDIYTDYQRVWKIYTQKRDDLRSQIQGEQRKLREQFVNEPAFNIENYLRDKEENALGALQRQAAILLVMLLFIEHLLIILDPVYYDDANDPKSWRERMPGGGHELTNLLNADIFGMNEAVAEANLLTPFKPFSVRQSADDLLDRSPLLLEHIKRYVGFRPFDLANTQLYLMDTFYTIVTADKPDRDVTVERLETFLENGLQHEEDWVRSVLKMLFIRYSGITFIEKDFLNFCPESRRRLEQIGIGGWLNEEIKKTLATCIQNGGFLNRSLVQICGEIKALGTAPSMDNGDGVLEKDLKTIKDSFRTFENYSIPDLNSKIDEEWSPKRIENLLEIFTYEARVSRPRRQNINDPLVIIVDFVEQNIQMVAQFLVRECHMKLTQETLGQVLDTLGKMPDVSGQLRKKREETELELQKNAETQIEKKNTQGTEEGAKKDTEKSINEPMHILSDYLYALQDFLFYGNGTDEVDGFMSYYKPQMITNYFDLSNLIIPYAPPADRPLYRPSVPRNQGQEGAADEGTLPCNLWFVLELRMVVKLLPIYFAAKFKLKYGNILLDNGSLLVESSSYPQEQTVDNRLKMLYESLIAHDSEGTLHRIMTEVSTELTNHYISQLGGI